MGFVSIYFTVCGFNRPSETATTVCIKSLPLMHLILMLLSTHFDDDSLSKNKNFTRYRKYVLFGFLFSLFGDAFLVWPNSQFIPGLLCFAFAHICYVFAFGFAPFGGVTFFLSMCLGIILYSSVLAGIEDDLVAKLAAIYTMLLCTVLWRAAIFALERKSFGSLCGLVGVALFVISDLLLAINRWSFRINMAALYIMITYYAAQLGLALSVHLYIVTPSQETIAKKRE